MHLHVIIAFSLVLWLPRQHAPYAVIGSSVGTWIVVLGQIGLLAGACMAAKVRLVGRLRAGDGIGHTQHALHRFSFIIRSLIVGSFAVDVLLTNWVPGVNGVRSLEPVYGLADLIVLMPFFVSSVLTFAVLYPVEAIIRERLAAVGDAAAAIKRSPISRWSYLLFNVRHHLLVVAVPMLGVMVGYAFTRDIHDWLYDRTGVYWASDAVLALIAGVIFFFAPVFLRFIWSTSPLAPGPLRDALEHICAHMGLRYREILVWNTGGSVVNAAVMGLVAPLRYVLLSDGMLETMTPLQIEAVFGHEAGHVRHKHIQYYVLFALITMLAIGGAMELAFRMAGMGAASVQLLGFVLVMLAWGVGFGWISRRFERQADVFGVETISRSPENCSLPCPVHGGASAAIPPEALCTSAAFVFGQTLHRIAVLNGISPEQRSWRHSSIASRIGFLKDLAESPQLAVRFRKVIDRTKQALLVLSVVTAIGLIWYLIRVADFN